jgi:DNA-binding MarR family transcriptional regulator
MYFRQFGATYPASVSSGFGAAAPATTAPAAMTKQSAPGASADSHQSAAGQRAAGQSGIDVARLRVAILRLSRRLRKHDLAGLTPSQLSTLSSVDKTGPVRLGDLAAAERIAPSTLTRLVNVLEDRGYLLRQPAPDDARASLVMLTASGHDVLERIRDEATSLLAEMIGTLPPGQLAALDAALPVLEELAGSG